MKSHISITIEREVLDELKRLSRQEHRSLSNLLELAALAYLKDRGTISAVKTSRGRFEGNFSRAETYGDR
jgi:predicted CopG family antitoxin